MLLKVCTTSGRQPRPNRSNSSLASVSRIARAFSASSTSSRFAICANNSFCGSSTSESNAAVSSGFMVPSLMAVASAVRKHNSQSPTHVSSHRAIALRATGRLKVASAVVTFCQGKPSWSDNRMAASVTTALKSAATLPQLWSGIAVFARRQRAAMLLRRKIASESISSVMEWARPNSALASLLLIASRNLARFNIASIFSRAGALMAETLSDRPTTSVSAFS